MTDTQAAPVAAAQIRPEQGSRLEQLHAAYATAKAAADDAGAKLKAVTDAIKVELTQAAPDAPRVDLVGDAGPRLHLTYSESWRVDPRKLRAEDPVMYARCAVKSGSWSLRVARSQQGGAE